MKKKTGERKKKTPSPKIAFDIKLNKLL